MSWQFGKLRTFGYDLLVVDPPWDFQNYSDAGTTKGADPHYDVLPIEQIKAFRIGDLARGDCLMLLWSTGCMLPQCLDAMRSWGFTYKSEIIWRKVTRNAKPRMGTGYRVRTMHEPILVGTVGNPIHKPFPSVLDGIAREHSRKPDEFYRMIDRYAANLSFRADVFCRQSRPGWASFGNEATKFDAEGITPAVGVAA